MNPGDKVRRSLAGKRPRCTRRSAARLHQPPKSRPAGTDLPAAMCRRVRHDHRVEDCARFRLTRLDTGSRQS
jgi:hypothetical protein